MSAGEEYVSDHCSKIRLEFDSQPPTNKRRKPATTIPAPELAPGGRALDFQVSKGETSSMIERKERKPYWRHTKWQMVASLAPFFAVIIILPLYADRLNSNKFLGFPLGYFLAAHGLVLIAVITVASFVRQQDAIDHWHGAHEDN